MTSISAKKAGCVQAAYLMAALFLSFSSFGCVVPPPPEPELPESVGTLIRENGVSVDISVSVATSVRSDTRLLALYQVIARRAFIKQLGHYYNPSSRDIVMHLKVNSFGVAQNAGRLVEVSASMSGTLSSGSFSRSYDEGVFTSGREIDIGRSQSRADDPLLKLSENAENNGATLAALLVTSIGTDKESHG